MPMTKVGVVAAALLLASCESSTAAPMVSLSQTPTVASTPSETATRFTPRPSPNSNGPVVVLYQALYDYRKYGPIIEATVALGRVTKRTVFAKSNIELTDSTAGLALVVVPPSSGTESWTNGPPPGTVAVSSGQVTTYDLGEGTTECVKQGPFGGLILACMYAGGQTQTFYLIDVSRGTSRVVYIGPPSGTPPALGWTGAGIVISSREGAVVVDPENSQITQLSFGGTAISVSPSGAYIGIEANVLNANYGCSDTLTLRHYDWLSRSSGGPQATQAFIVSQTKKDFRIVDVGDDGGVLYTAADCVSPHSPPAATTLYYFSGGRSTRQVGLTGVYTPGWDKAADNSHGKLLGDSVAVIGRSLTSYGATELDLVHLCFVDNCQPQVTPIVRGDPSAADYAFSILRS